VVVEPGAGANAEQMHAPKRVAQLASVQSARKALEPGVAGLGNQIDGALIDAFEQEYVDVAPLGRNAIVHRCPLCAIREAAELDRSRQGSTPD
jgi:hypothetical protein